MIAIILAYLGLLYVAGKHHRDLQKSRSNHPTGRVEASQPREPGQMTEKSTGPSKLAEPLPSSPTEGDSVRHRSYVTLKEVIEAAARAEEDGHPEMQFPVSADWILRRLLDIAASTRKHCSGVVLERPGESVYLAVIAWDGRSTIPARRTMERLLNEFEDSGCEKMAVVTDAPRSFCAMPKGPEGEPPAIVPAEGLKPLLDGLEALGSR